MDDQLSSKGQPFGFGRPKSAVCAPCRSPNYFHHTQYFRPVPESAFPQGEGQSGRSRNKGKGANDPVMRKAILVASLMIGTPIAPIG
jgi:hypothetical protein